MHPASPLLLALSLATGPARAAGSWTEHLAFAGDLRYRNEWSLTRPGDEDMRWRQRVRARLGLTATVIEDQVWGGLRLRTGNPADANSPHQTLGEGFASFDVGFDQVYLAWAPGGGTGTIWAGKFEDPLYDSPVYGDLLIDDDINPEGVAASIPVVGGEGVRWTLLPAAWLLLEVDAGVGDAAFDTDDGYLFAGQSQLELPVGESTLTVANAFYLIPDPTPADDPTLLAGNGGNATNAAGTEYLSDFRILDNVVGLDLVAGERTVSLAARVVVNLGADKENLGWQGGLKVPFSVGKLGMDAFVDVHGLQREAFYSDFIGDDQQSDIGYKGGVGGLTFKPVKPLGIRVWGIVDRPDQPAPEDPAVFSRVRVDVNARF